MICRNCGKTINDQATFCGYCNAIVKPEQIKAQRNLNYVQQPVQQQIYPPVAPQQFSPMPPQVPQKKPKDPVYKKWWFWTVLILILILVSGIIFMISNTDDNSDSPVTVTNVPSANVIAPDVSESNAFTTVPAQTNAPEITTEEHNESFDGFDDGYNYDDDNDFEYKTFRLEETVKTENTAEFKIYDAYDTENNFNLGDIPDERYFIIELTIKNLTDKEIYPTNIYAEYVFGTGDVYDIEALTVYKIEENNKLITYHTIAPGETADICIICSVPSDLIAKNNKIEFIIGFDSEFSSKPIYYGKDACRYLYKTTLEKTN